ncbi:hypothetical protein ACFWOT_32600 [Streptomyces sp. NPDC058440]|uniref:hypothetical protein n=1 Tax=Streptomyces sp. NPDC058440 TaxID=3346501 RepID=UPI0036586AA7
MLNLFWLGFFGVLLPALVVLALERLLRSVAAAVVLVGLDGLAAGVANLPVEQTSGGD